MWSTNTELNIVNEEPMSNTEIRYIAMCFDGASGAWGRGDTIEEAKSRMKKEHGKMPKRYLVNRYEWDRSAINCPEGEGDEPCVVGNGRTSYYGTETEVEAKL